MENSQVEKDFLKVKDIITSCNNLTQLKVAVRTYNNLINKHKEELTTKQKNILQQLIGLMRLKCKGSNTPVEKEVNEIFNSGEDFKRQLNVSGVRDLQDLSPQMKEEINIGTQIEGNHLSLKDAKEVATKNVEEISDYYSDPDYCIIAVENKNGEKKTVRVEKDLYEKSKENKEQLLLADMEIFHENLDMNDIAQSLKDQLKKQHRKRYSKEEMFDEIRRRRKIELERREELSDDSEIDEATGAGSAGAYVGPINRKPISRKFAKNEIPVSVNGLNKPIGNLYSLNVLEEEEEIEEAVDYGGAVGAYVTPAMWAKNTKNWRGAHKLTYPGGKFVNIKEKCSTYPYCNQGYGSKKDSPITLTNTSQMKIDNVFNENKIVKKSNLKLKK